MTELVKQAVQLAEEELKNKQVDEVKKIVLKTLEKLDQLQKERKEIDEKIKILKCDIEDLKSGKIDRIVERQEKDEKARATSVVVIIKEKEVHHHYDYWHWPYIIYWPKINTTKLIYEPIYEIGNNDDVTILYGNTTNTYSTNSAFTTSTINCSVAKDATIGTYTLADTTIHLR